MVLRAVSVVRPIFLLATACGVLTGVACHHAHRHPADAGEVSVVYTCPMHADVVVHAAGSCPTCGAALVIRE